jgi:hypothetical protein
MAAVDEVVAAKRAESVKLPGDLMRAVRVFQDLMVSILAPRALVSTQGPRLCTSGGCKQFHSRRWSSGFRNVT